SAADARALHTFPTRRPSDLEQLAQIGRQIGVATLPVVFGELPVAIARRAMETGRREGYDVVFIDTAGRLGIDEKMMQEAIAVRRSEEHTSELQSRENLVCRL